MKTVQTALTFDDVLLVPKYSDIQSRRDVNLQARLTKNISLQLPIISSNMDTVTEAEMAIAMAKAGGIGIIHRFNSVAEQVSLIRKVKRAEAYIIYDPYTVKETDTIAEVRNNGRNVKSFVVCDDNRVLQGLITSRDMRFAADKQTVADVMTPIMRLVTAPPTINRETARRVLYRNRIGRLPLVNPDGTIGGLITVKDLMKAEQFPNATRDAKHRLRVGAAIGVKPEDIFRCEELVNAGCDVIVLDIAHGHSKLAGDTVRAIKERMPDVQLIGGNVATAEGTRFLIEAGVDAVKVGVGGGSICITRIVTGAGVPQLTAIFECAAVAREVGIPLIADGGIRNSGDIAKAIAAGADTVMLGSVLAGTDESPGRVLVKNGRRVKILRGMAGYGANLSKAERSGTKKDDVFDMTPEGVEAQVAYKGPVHGILSKLGGGLRSAASYCGGHTMDEMRDNAEFIRITNAGRVESRSHDVSVI